MIYRLLKILPILLILLFASCDNETVQLDESPFLSDADSILIKVIPHNEPIEIGKYIDSVFYVKLELTDESIIGQIDKLIIFENRIHILDTQTSSVFIFDMTGKYLSKICRIGNGPGEYRKLHFFDIDKEKRQIVLVDLLSMWIMRYDFDGKYISRKRIQIFTISIIPSQNGEYISFSNFRNNSRFLAPEYNLMYLDSLFQIDKVYFPYYSKNFYNPFIPFITNPSGPFYTFNNQIHFTYNFKNEVYIVNNEGLALKYKFDFNGKNFRYSSIQKKDGLYDYVLKGTYWTINQVCESDDMLSFTFSDNSDKTIYTGFYSKRTGNVINSTRYLLTRMRFLYLPISSHEDWLISEFPVDDLLEWRKLIEKMNDALEEKGYKGERDKFLGYHALIARKRVADSLTFEDNPVLMFFRLKPF